MTTVKIDPFAKIRRRDYAIVPAAPRMPYIDMGLEQGTPEWRAARFDHITASDVAAVMGRTKYKKRDALMEEKLSRQEPPIDDFKRRLFDMGHLAEDAARRWANQNLGVTFRPVVLRSVAHPFLLASLDGFDPGHDLTLEAKYLGAEALRDVASRKIKAHHLIQIQTQLLVTGAKRCMYFAMDPNGNAEVVPVYPDPALMAEIAHECAKFWLEWQSLKEER